MTTHNRDNIFAAANEAGFIYYGDFPQDYKCKIEAFYTIAHEAGRQAEREECIGIVESYKVSVGNSHAGEMACKWTMENLREIRDAIRARSTK